MMMECEREEVKTAAYKSFYSSAIGKRETKAKQALIVAQIEDACELAGLI